MNEQLIQAVILYLRALRAREAGGKREAVAREWEAVRGAFDATKLAGSVPSGQAELVEDLRAIRRIAGEPDALPPNRPGRSGTLRLVLLAVLTAEAAVVACDRSVWASVRDFFGCPKNTNADQRPSASTGENGPTPVVPPPMAPSRGGEGVDEGSPAHPRTADAPIVANRPSAQPQEDAGPCAEPRSRRPGTGRLAVPAQSPTTPSATTRPTASGRAGAGTPLEWDEFLEEVRKAISDTGCDLLKRTEPWGMCTDKDCIACGALLVTFRGEERHMRRCPTPESHDGGVDYLALDPEGHPKWYHTALPADELARLRAALDALPTKCALARDYNPELEDANGAAEESEPMQLPAEKRPGAATPDDSVLYVTHDSTTCAGCRGSVAAHAVTVHFNPAACKRTDRPFIYADQFGWRPREIRSVGSDGWWTFDLSVPGGAAPRFTFGGFFDEILPPSQWSFATITESRWVTWNPDLDLQFRVEGGAVMPVH